MSVLVLAEHNNTEIKSSTLNTIGAASQIDQNIEVLLVGNSCEDLANKIVNIQNVNKVIVVDDPQYQNPIAENIAPIIISLANNYSHILAPATTFGKNILPRVAAILDIAQISDIIKVESKDTFVRPIYAGNALATVQSTDEKKIITVRPTSFEQAATEGGSGEVEKITFDLEKNIVEFVGREESKSDRPELGTARVVISGGRGLQSAENFSMLNAIADKLNAAVGASRAAVDAGYVGNDYQVGQTGKVVVPDLYIAVGISGAIQHLAGMKESKVIVAINKDEEAPIFQIADYGWVTDLFTALPELEAALAEELEGLAEAEVHEVERAIALTESDLVRGLERVSQRADLLSMFELYFDDPNRLNTELDRLRAVTVDEIRAFAKERLGPDNRAVLTYEPKGEA